MDAESKRLYQGYDDYYAACDRTVAFVKASCEADGLPDWIIGMVEARVKIAIIRRTYPLLGAAQKEASA